MDDHSHDHDPERGHHDGHVHHPHPHHGHDHAPLRPSVLGWAMVATLGLVVAEVFGGVLGRSVALLNDAVHNLSDVPALGISWLAMRWAERPADSEKTYGYHRAGILAAFTNAVLLVLLSLWLGYQAVERFRSPIRVVESWMIWTSLAALAVNGGITLALVRGRGDLNLRSILVHNFGDALSNIAIIAGAIAIRMTGAPLDRPPARHCHWSAGPLVERRNPPRVCPHPPGRPPGGRCASARSPAPSSPSTACKKSTTSTSGRWAAGTTRSASTREFRICTWINASACCAPFRRKLQRNSKSITPRSSSSEPDSPLFPATSCPNP